MTETRTRTFGSIVARTLLGALVVLLTVPTGVGPAAGGWVAGRGGRGVAASAVAGLLGAVPWGVLAYLAASGTIAPVGYHQGVVHVGVTTATPGALVPWQEVGLAVLCTAVLAGTAVVGGVLAARRDRTAVARSGDPVR
jgi:hypothetical protein